MSGKSIPVIFVLIWLVVGSTDVRAQPTVRLDDADGLHSIGKSTLVFRDPVHRPLAAVLAEERRGAFRPYLQDVPNFAATEDAIWLKFSVVKAVDRPFYLQLGSAFLDSVSLYREAGLGPVLIKEAGDNRPFAEREVQHPSYLLELDLEVGDSATYYLRTRSYQPHFYTLRVGTLKAFLEDLHTLDFIQGIYFGIMLLIFAYNGLLYVNTRDRVYLYYGFYLISITLFMSFVYHYLFQYLWPAWPGINHYAVISAALTIFTAVVFSRQFLATKTVLPRLHRVSHLFVGIAAVIVLLILLEFHIPALLTAQFGILLMALYLIVIGVVAYRRGYSPAKFYLLAWSALVLGFVAAMLESLNLFPVNPYINPMQIGSALEATLLSFALADRINTYKQQRAEAQAAALAAAEEKSVLIAQQNEVLERKVSERTQQLNETLQLVEIERGKSDDLLLNILPSAIADELKEHGHAEPQHFASVSVLFLDVVGFSNLSKGLPATELVVRLDRIFVGIDEIVRRHGLEKIKTIGDAYMAAGGIPEVTEDHALATINAAREIHAYMSGLPADSRGCRWEMRSGIHTGPVVAGVVGQNKFAYDIWGQTVNLAARLEAKSSPGRVNVSKTTYGLVRERVACSYRGEIEVKNMGVVEMYFVDE